MKVVTQQFPVVEGRFVDKEQFISEHPDLASYLEPLPDETYFEYDEKSSKISYHLDTCIQGEIPESSCDYFPLIVAQGIRNVEDFLSTTRKGIKLGSNQITHSFNK